MTTNAEARDNVWLGEVAALEESLTHLRRRRAEAEAKRSHPIVDSVNKAVKLWLVAPVAWDAYRQLGCVRGLHRLYWVGHASEPRGNHCWTLSRARGVGAGGPGVTVDGKPFGRSGTSTTGGSLLMTGPVVFKRCRQGAVPWLKAP
jgi:hypothetical protein